MIEKLLHFQLRESDERCFVKSFVNSIWDQRIVDLRRRISAVSGEWRHSSSGLPLHLKIPF